MKDPQKLQRKLLDVLRKDTHHPKINPPANGYWSIDDLAAVAWVIQDHVNRNDEVIECNLLKDWIEEYKFFIADRK